MKRLSFGEKLVAFFACVFVVVLLFGMAKDAFITVRGVDVVPRAEAELASTNDVYGFEVIGKYNLGDGISQFVLFDPYTNVMYTMIKQWNGSSASAGVTPIYNSDGTLKLYNP